MMNMASISSKYSHRDHSRKSPLRQSLKNPSRISITLPNSSPLRASERKLAVKAKIEELLECMICLGRTNNPQMCPSCSNLCCYSCIKRWLTEKKSQCPRCGRDLRVSQLINCKLMTDIASAVDNMEMYRPKDKTTVEICTAHNVELSYYCKECKVPVCSDCAIFGQEHKGHEFQHISKVYDQQVELIKAEEKALNARINNLVGSLSAVEANIQKITDMKEEKAIELEAVIDQMSQRLDSEFKSKILALLAQKGSTGDEIEFLKAMERELEEQIAHPVQNKLVVKTKELVRMLRDVAGKPLPKLNKASMNTELISEVVPSFASSTFLLKQYSVLKRTEEVVYSDPLTESGMSWRLKVYPSGRGNAKGTHISVFLERIKGSEDPREFEYRVELVNQKNPEICLKRESISELESTECWGYIRFYRIELLEQDGYILPHKDTLMFKFYVRSPNYFHQAEIQQKYIKYLEEAKSKSTALMSQLKTKFKEERERTEKKKDPNLRYEQRTSDKPSNSGDATNEGTSFKDKIERASEDEEEKYESLNTVRPVSSGHEDNDQEGTARKIWDDSTSSRIQPQISAMVKDRTDEGDHASYVESEGPISGEREGLSFQDLFGKKEKLDMGRRNMVKKGADKVSPRQKDYYRRDKGLLQGLGGMKMKTEVNGSKDDVWDEFEGLSLKQEKSHIGQKDSYDYDALHPIDLEAIFGHQNEEEKRVKDHKSKDKYPVNKKKVLRDPSLFLLPESVNKKLNNLKTVDVRKSLNIEKGNQDLLNGFEKENLPSYF